MLVLCSTAWDLTGGHSAAQHGVRGESSDNSESRCFIAGADAIATAEQKIADLKAQIEANRALSTSLTFD